MWYLMPVYWFGEQIKLLIANIVRVWNDTSSIIYYYSLFNEGVMMIISTWNWGCELNVSDRFLAWSVGLRRGQTLCFQVYFSVAKDYRELKNTGLRPNLSFDSVQNTYMFHVNLKYISKSIDFSQLLGTCKTINVQ